MWMRDQREPVESRRVSPPHLVGFRKARRNVGPHHRTWLVLEMRVGNVVFANPRQRCEGRNVTWPLALDDGYALEGRTNLQALTFSHPLSSGWPPNAVATTAVMTTSKKKLRGSRMSYTEVRSSCSLAPSSLCHAQLSLQT